MINQNITPEELQYIDRYLQKELTEDELADFNLRLDNEPGFKEKLNEVQLMLLAIAETGIEDKMKTYHQKVPAPLPNAKTRSITLRYFAIAASVAIILSLTVWLLLQKGDDKQDLYAKYYQPDPGLMTVMSTTDHYDFEKAMVAYRNGEYQQAANSWKQQLNDHPASDTIGYFLGAAYQAMKKTDSAKIYFSKIAAQTGSSFYKDANWYMGLIYLQTNQRTEAISHLRLSAHHKAEALINELEK